MLIELVLFFGFSVVLSFAIFLCFSFYFIGVIVLFSFLLFGILFVDVS